MVERGKKAPLVACSDKETAAYVAKALTTAEVVKEILMADDGADACDRMSAIVEQMESSKLGFTNTNASEEEHPWLVPYDPALGCSWCGSDIPSDGGTCGSCGRLQ